MKKVAPGCLLVLAVALLSSCSINRLAVRAVSGMLSGGGESTVFTGEEDPELVGDALPLALKIYESLLASDPTNAALALSTGQILHGRPVKAVRIRAAIRIMVKGG